MADNVAALESTLSPEQLRTLEEARGVRPMNLYAIFQPTVNRMVFGGQRFQGWRA